MEAIIEAKIGDTTLLKMKLWELITMHFIHHTIGMPPLEEIRLYLNGEEVEKPPEMEDE